MLREPAGGAKSRLHILQQFYIAPGLLNTLRGEMMPGTQVSSVKEGGRNTHTPCVRGFLILSLQRRSVVLQLSRSLRSTLAFYVGALATEGSAYALAPFFTFFFLFFFFSCLTPSFLPLMGEESMRFRLLLKLFLRSSLGGGVVAATTAAGGEDASAS